MYKEYIENIISSLSDNSLTIPLASLKAIGTGSIWNQAVLFKFLLCLISNHKMMQLDTM